MFLHTASTRLAAFVLLVLLAACGAPEDLELPLTPADSTQAPAPAASPSPTEPTLPEALVVCLGQEPASLYRYSAEYLYGPTGRTADVVLEALYDGPFDVLDYQYQARILEKIPSLEDGDVLIQAVTVSDGSVYFNPESLQPEGLAVGKSYLPAGCEDRSCAQQYNGGQVQMDQLVVEFRLLPDLLWSDGAPLTAADSRYAFDLDAHPDTPTTKVGIDHTTSYEVLDERSLRWTGIPGYMDPEFGAHFWSPLPEHVLGAENPEALQSSEQANKAPLGWGPYSIVSWEPGSHIELTRNPNYFLAADGLPAFENLLFRFVDSGALGSIEQLLTSECDVLDETAIADTLDRQAIDLEALELLLDLQAAGTVALSSAPGPEMMRIELNTNPLTEPALLAQPETRRALAACLDRQALIETQMLGLSAVPQSYLPPGHPLAADDLEGIGYDPQAARAALEQSGWVQEGAGSGVWRSQGVPDLEDGTPLAFSLLTTEQGLNPAVAEALRAGWAACGIEVTIEYLPQNELFAAWPEGAVFGRSFQSVAWAWLNWVGPLCEPFLTQEIPGDGFPIGINASGFSDPEFDRACQTLLLGHPGSPAYQQALRNTQERFLAGLPSIPLYMRPRLVAYAPAFCGVEVDSSAVSALWNLESIQWGDACPASDS